MTDLHDLLTAESDRLRPALTPPFSDVVAVAGRRRRRRQAAAAATIAVLVAAVAVPVSLAGRGGYGTPVAPGTAAATPTPASRPAAAPPLIVDGPRDPLIADPAGQDPVDERLLPTRPTPGAVGKPEVPSWRLLALAGGGRRLVIEIPQVCETLDYVDVEQTPTRVRVAPVYRSHVSVAACGLRPLTFQRGSVVLLAPLGGRALVHARPTPGAQDVTVSSGSQGTADPEVQPGWSQALQSRFDALASTVEARFPSVFAGAVPDWATGRLNVYLTGNGHRDIEVSALDPAIVIHRARYTQAQLQAQMSRITRENEFWPVDGVTWAGVSPRQDGSGVDLTVTRVTPGLVAAVQSRFGADISVTQGDLVHPADAPAQGWAG